MTGPHTRRAATLVGFVGALLTACAAAAGVKPAEKPAEGGLEPVARPTFVLVSDRPLVTVTFQGIAGPLQVKGTLESAPKDPLRITDAGGRPRDVAWTEVAGLTITEYPQEGLPVGSFQVALVSEQPANASGAGGYGSAVRTGVTGGAGYAGWRLLRLPEGNLTLRGDPYGSMTIPAVRLTGLSMLPIRGELVDLPQGMIRIQVLDDTTVSVPLPRVQLLRRDVSRGTITVTIDDQQTFAGKLLELPKVTLRLGEEMMPIMVPLERVISLQRTSPGAIGNL